MARLYLLFAAIYLLEGITEVPFVLNVYLSQVLSFTPSQVGRVLFLGGLWFIVLKPLIGFLADWWRGFDRRWFMLGGLLASVAGWLVIAAARTPLMMTLGVSLKVLAVAVLDVIIDGMIVRVSTARNRSFIQSLVYACRFGGGMLLASWAGGRIDQGAAAFIQIYYLFSLLSLAALLPVLLYRRKDYEAAPSPEAALPGSVGAMATAIPFGQRLEQLGRPAFGWLLLLLLLYALGADTATYFDPILAERFSGEFLGRITTVYYLGILAGILSFPVLRARAGMRGLLVASLLGWSAAELSCLWIAEWNGPAIYFAGGFFNAFSSIALLTIATASCRLRGIETFSFAVAISVKNLLDQTNVLIGGYVMEAVGIEWLFVISAACGLLPFLVLGRIDFREV